MKADDVEDHKEKHSPCKVIVEFDKRVTQEGNEITDQSIFPFNPRFEVECDEQWIQNSYGRRFTDLLGTRIQTETNAYPALVLPPKALSIFPHSMEGRLELGNDTYHGTCLIFGDPVQSP